MFITLNSAIINILDMIFLQIETQVKMMTMLLVLKDDLKKRKECYVKKHKMLYCYFNSKKIYENFQRQNKCWNR